jgi:exodeoxyribonuclease VII large subunit
MPLDDLRATRPPGIPGVSLSGPWPVGAYAAKLRDELRKRARVQLFGEVWGFKASRARVYFELRDAEGAVPCAMWLQDFEALGLAAASLVDGARVVVAGGPDYYPGSRNASPHFSFHVTSLRPAGEGDLLAQLDLLRKKLDGEGLFAPQKALPRPALPRSIGVVTGEGGKARDDVLAGLSRRGWAGRLVWGFAPVQDRHAAPAITRALQDLAACGDVEVIVVARGGGSLADLFCFCDETLCRTVALLPVPVIASVGHHTDRTLLDDVAAVSCSTPTHAAESAVPRHCGEARAELARTVARLERHATRIAAERPRTAALAARLRRHASVVAVERPRAASLAERLAAHGRRAVVERARVLAGLARAPSQHVARERVKLHQWLREVRASGLRRVRAERALVDRELLVVRRKAAAAGVERTRACAELAETTARLRRAADAALAARETRLSALGATVAAHDPELTLARGYALVEDRRSGELIVTAEAARTAAGVRIRFADAAVDATIEEEKP